VQSGSLEIVLDGDSPVVAEAWDVFSTPAGVWRTLRAVGDEPVVAVLVTSGDARVRIEWTQDVIEAAREIGVGIDPNGYVASAEHLPLVAAA
jgi:hypothetical protein